MKIRHIAILAAIASVVLLAWASLPAARGGGDGKDTCVQGDGTGEEFNCE